MPPKELNEILNEIPAAIDGRKLWDEILKAIVTAMPSQLFPLFKEVYGKEYPPDTPVTLLSTETSSFPEERGAPPGSTFMDMTLLVAGTDHYHLECQMRNESEMVIRMFSYDVRFAIQHARSVDQDTGEIILHFPRSVVIYPERNSAIPDRLRCRVIFQDDSEHIYEIPTVKIQSYSLEDIRQKHLTLFIPYTILRLRPKLRSKLKHPLTKTELTEFLNDVIFLLNTELNDGYLSQEECSNYLALFRHAVDRVLAKHPALHKEAKDTMETSIILPSMIFAEQRAKIAEMEAENRRLRKLLADHNIEVNYVPEEDVQKGGDSQSQ